jgi:hypothetical protein
MLKKILFTALLISAWQGLGAQTNIICTSAEAERVMRGMYHPASYHSASTHTAPDLVAETLAKQVSPDSLKQIIMKLASFQNRNTASDTLSASKGIGAARRWIHAEFERYARQSQGRLLPAYLQFDLNVCNLMNQHRNVLAVLPGTDTADKSIIIIEGHFDSRCEGNCDTGCLAEGVEDNASGTALVMELARVMSGMRFKRTIVFMPTTGEEQGLHGAFAFVYYALQKGITIRSVLNNDVTGGVICGRTASPPGCPGEDQIDSIRVRLFSAGNINSPSKQLARFVKLQYREMLARHMTTPSDIQIMSPEDRTGRGGDHIPFRQNGFPAIRFTSAHEHGDANVGAPNYTDRQHTTRDIAGIDTDSDGNPDSFFVDFRYLARNACINGTAAAMSASGPARPDLSLQVSGKTLFVTITAQTAYTWYRVAVRSSSQDWDTVLTQHGVNGMYEMPDGRSYYVSAASVDEAGVESIFSREVTGTTTGLATYEHDEVPAVVLEQNHPNPFDEATWIVVRVNTMPTYRKAALRIHDQNGRLLREIPVQLKPGMNEFLYEHGDGMRGILLYSLWLDGKKIAGKTMVFAN